MWDNLPTEITTLILLKLPVKTLIVCTSLSKSFFSLITTHEFICTHIAQNPTTHFFLRFLIDAKGEEYYHLEPDNDNFTGFQNEGLLMTFDDSDYYWFNVVGCVNGVICLVDDFYFEGTTITLWNPSIRKYVRLPRPHYVFQSYGPYESACGFGFDSVTNDYKVVRVVELEDRVPYSEEREVEIYSLRSGCWRNVGICPKYHIKGTKEGYIPCFFNGSVHWVAFCSKLSKRDSVILKFNMSEESFEIMELPSMLKESLLRYYTHEVEFYVLECKGMFSLFSRSPMTCCVWVMKEYGVADSWTKMIEFNYGDAYFSRIPRALSFRSNGELIVVKGGSYYEKNKNMIVSFNPATHAGTMLGELIDDIHPSSFYLSTYVEGKGIKDHTRKNQKVMVNDGDEDVRSSLGNIVQRLISQKAFHARPSEAL